MKNIEKTIFTVSELNLACKKMLEDHFPDVWIEGEISNLSKPSSGHIYFSLKDEKAQIRAAFFRQYNTNLPFELRNGLLVQVKSCVSIYPDRGDYQLIVEKMTLAGEGLLRQAYEKLLAKLKEEGLFDPSYKKTIPAYPKRIGVITSSTGAALRDILHVLNRRFPSAEIIIFPTAVQGTNAAPEIVSAIQMANKMEMFLPEKEKFVCDVLLLARGGGSLEDLWPFNEEIVARAIFASHIPIVTGIGHETDVTISDFVADLRAPTPSAAAESVSPDLQEVLRRFQHFEELLHKKIIQQFNYRSQHLDNLIKRLRHPGQHIEFGIKRLNLLHPRLIQAIQRVLTLKQQDVTEKMRTLQAVSPLATLNRGYAIASNEEDVVLSSIENINLEDKIKIRMKDGELQCSVNAKQPLSEYKKKGSRKKIQAVEG